MESLRASAWLNCNLDDAAKVILEGVAEPKLSQAKAHTPLPLRGVPAAQAQSHSMIEESPSAFSLSPRTRSRLTIGERWIGKRWSGPVPDRDSRGCAAEDGIFHPHAGTHNNRR